MKYYKQRDLYQTIDTHYGVRFGRYVFSHGYNQEISMYYTIAPCNVKRFLHSEWKRLKRDSRDWSGYEDI